MSAANQFSLLNCVVRRETVFAVELCCPQQMSLRCRIVLSEFGDNSELVSSSEFASAANPFLYTITPSTASCDWCHIICPVVFGDINNLYSLGVIEKYLSFFMCYKSLFPVSSGFIMGMLKCSALGQHVEVLTRVNFLVS